MTDFEIIAAEVAQLVAEKNVAYGDSFAISGVFMELLYPNGIQPSQYGDALTFIRIFDKMKRIATNPNAFGEDPRRDILGYAILNVARVSG